MKLKKSKENLRAQLPYKRTQRVGEQIQEILGEIALKYINLSPFGFVTFTSVDLSPDFHLAKVYFSVYQPKKEIQEIERELNRLIKAFKKYMGPELHIRTTPDLQFIFDESMVYHEKIEEVLNSITPRKKNDR